MELMRIRNDYFYLPEKDQREICEKRLVEVFLSEKGIAFEQLPSLTEEFKGGNTADPVAKNLKEMSDALMKKYGTTNMPDFRLAGKDVFVHVAGVEGKEKSFAVLLEKGCRIIIAKPVTRLEGNEAVLDSLEWEEYTKSGKCKPAEMDDFA